MESKLQYVESCPGATLPGVVGHQGTAAGSGSSQKSISSTTDNVQLPKEIGNTGESRTQSQGPTAAGSLEKKLKASSSSSHHEEVPMEEANARFLKHLQQVYSLSKGLEEEVTAAPNTKREIKALITQLSNGVKGLIQWGRLTGKVCASTSSRGIPTDPDTTKKNAEKRTTEVQTSPHKENVDGAMLASENTIPSPDRSRFELPAAIEGLRQMVISQGEVIAKLVENVENIQVKPVKPQQRRQQKTPPRQNAQLEEEQQPLRSDSQEQSLSGTAEKWETVSRRRRKKEPHTRIRPDAVIVKADTYRMRTC